MQKRLPMRQPFLFRQNSNNPYSLGGNHSKKISQQPKKKKYSTTKNQKGIAEKY